MSIPVKDSNTGSLFLSYEDVIIGVNMDGDGASERSSLARVGKLSLELPSAGEHLDAVVIVVGDKDFTIRFDGDVIRSIELGCQ